MQNPVTATPVTEIFCPDAGENRIFLKRDDLQPFSFGGNKVRIAWEFLTDLREKGCDAMLMYGDARSNLCRVLSGMCRMEGIPARMIASGRDEMPAPLTFNERIVRLFGVPVRYTDRERIAEAVDEEMAFFECEGRKPYYIYGSRLGTGNESCAGRAYAKAYREILSDETRLGVRFDLIVCPYGTGATLGGLIAGAMENHDGDRLLGISISSRTEERAKEILEKTVAGYLKERGLPADSARIRERMHLLTGYNCGGYGIVDEAVLACVRDMLLMNSVPMAPEYSGKAFLGLVRYLRERGIVNKNILFLHTGGLPLFFDALTGQPYFAR